MTARRRRAGAALLGHAKASVTQGDIRAGVERLTKAADAVSGRVTMLMAGADNVAPLASAKGV